MAEKTRKEGFCVLHGEMKRREGEWQCQKCETLAEKREVIVAGCPNCGEILNVPLIIDGAPAIRLGFRFPNGQEDSVGHLLYVSSVWGSTKLNSYPPIPTDTLLRIFCPFCRVKFPGMSLCQRCNAPVIKLRAEFCGTIDVCSRRGCSEHKIIVNAAVDEPPLNPFGEPARIVSITAEMRKL